MVHYRAYRSGDEQDIVSLWNKCLVFDPITLKRFRNMVLLDANFDGSGLRLAVEEDRVVGCLFAVRRRIPLFGSDLETENGWISFFFVAPDYRRKGVGTRLMKEGCQFLSGEGTQNIFFSSYAPNYFLPGIDAASYPEGMMFLQNQHFERVYSPVAMDRSLIGYTYPDEVRKLKNQREDEGYQFQEVQMGDLPELITFTRTAFNPDWSRAIREGVLQHLPLERMRIVRHEEEIVGFCMHGGYEGIPDRFGPFGIHPDQQGKGLGKVLLHDTLHHMRAEGLHGAWFLWTGEQTAAGFLYTKYGFSTTRTFHVMKRIMNENKHAEIEN